MNFLEQFRINWRKNFHQFTPDNCYLIIAVSGGVDSVVLTNVLVQLGYNFSIAHCNFNLRGEESSNDEKFVVGLAAQYKKEVLIQHFNTVEYAQINKVSTQVAARELRYKWFDDLIHLYKNKATHVKLLTAHHADDTIETVLMNIFRGTGITGLHGILPIQKNTLRPLLFASKKEIIAFANTHNLLWVEDASNAKDSYTRNFFRHNIIPKVKEVYVQAEENLLANIERWKEVELIYNNHIDLIKSKIIEHKGNELHIPVLKLLQYQPLNTIVFEIVKDFGFTAAQVSDIIQLLNADNGKFIASSSHRVIRNRNWLIIAALATKTAHHILIETLIPCIEFAEGIINFTLLENVEEVSTNTQIVHLDASKVDFPMMLRPWKISDYFYPLGMQKKKKINRFLIDKKLSITAKEKVWVLESNQKIIWVVGQRIDDRFKVTNKAKKILQLQLKLI